MDHHEEALITAKPPENPFNQIVPALLTAAVVGLAGLFMQVAKLDQSVSTVAADIRVRHIEMTVGSKK
jgi:hypothetical protein